MSVYTRLTKEELEQLLNHYDIGEFVSIEGINEGITNSNFYLETSNSKYILTIFEEPNLNLDYAISLMSLLSKNHIPCPTPIKTKNKKTVLSIQNKPLSIFTLLPGNTISKKVPTKKMCVSLLLCREQQLLVYPSRHCKLPDRLVLAVFVLVHDLVYPTGQQLLGN